MWWNKWFRRKPVIKPIEQLLEGLDTNLEIDDFRNFLHNHYTPLLQNNIEELINQQKQVVLITLIGCVDKNEYEKSINNPEYNFHIDFLPLISNYPEEYFVENILVTLAHNIESEWHV